MEVCADKPKVRFTKVFGQKLSKNLCWYSDGSLQLKDALMKLIETLPFQCMQDGIVLCRLVNAISKLRCERFGESFKLVHFRENIGNSVFFARINIETFIR